MSAAEPRLLVEPDPRIALMIALAEIQKAIQPPHTGE